MAGTITATARWMKVVELRAGFQATISMPAKGEKGEIYMKIALPMLLAGGGLLFTMGMANAEQIVKPHTFTAGTPASATEVNNNFDTLFNQSNKVGSEVNIDSLNGRVGIGTAAPGAKLDVQGSVKIGYAGNACDTASAGTLRYDSSEREMQYCDGTSWKALEPKTPIVWSGGCSYHGTSGTWQTYCTDQVDFNTAANYFTVAPTGTITFTKAGYYRINYFALTRGATINVIFKKNGQAIKYFLMDGATGWFPVEMGHITPFTGGDVFLVEALAGTYNYLAHGQQSGLQITYEGPLN